MILPIGVDSPAYRFEWQIELCFKSERTGTVERRPKEKSLLSVTKFTLPLVHPDCSLNMRLPHSGMIAT